MEIVVKNMLDEKSYVSTKKAADILRLSVGTVQKLADSKHLEAYVTAGKHRRISFDSIKIYSEKLGIKNLAGSQKSPEIAHTCLILNPDNPTWDNLSVDQSESLTIIKSPFDFLTTQKNIDNILIDAQTTWIDFKNLNEEALISKAKFKMIFNIDKLDQETQNNLSGKFLMNSQTINKDTLYGLIMGLSLVNEINAYKNNQGNHTQIPND